MKAKNIFVLLLFISFSSFSKGQSDNDIVATVGDLPISVGELKYAYAKDSKDTVKGNSSISNFLDTYIIYKRKIAEALSQKLDTVSSLKKEYETSMNQLEEPYLKDTAVVQDLAKVIYKRLDKNFRVKDIVVALPLENSIYPKDTLEAYNIAKKIRADIKNNGSNYNEIVDLLNASSSAQQGIVTGDYGWIGSLMLDPTIENQIYSLKKGEVSKEPFRTEVGYHILKIEDERPDIGAVEISNIILEYPKEATSLQKDSVNNLANQIYEKLENGANFSTMHKQYSSDYLVNPNGLLGYFNVQRPLSPIYLEAISEVPTKGYSKPIQRETSVRIIKVNNRIDRYEWDGIKKEIESRLQKDQTLYQNFITQQKIKVLSQKTHYKVNNNIYTQLEILCNTSNPFTEEFENMSNPFSSQILLSIEKRDYSVADFLLFIKQNLKRLDIYRLSTDKLNYALNDFIYTLLLEVKKQSLQKDFPELFNLSREYYGGLLYYNLMNKEVWDKAQADKTGLQEVYNKKKNTYKWENPRFEGLLIFAKNEQIKNQVQNFIRKNKNNKDLILMLKNNFNKNGESSIIIEKGLWSKGENSFIDNLVYKVPTTKVLVDYPESFVEGSLIKSPRNLDDVKGQVVEDYQKILEQQLNKQLQTKYRVDINQKVLDQLITKEK